MRASASRASLNIETHDSGVYDAPEDVAPPEQNESNESDQITSDILMEDIEDLRCKVLRSDKQVVIVLNKLQQL
jgi:hypothetical protein